MAPRRAKVDMAKVWRPDVDFFADTRVTKAVAIDAIAHVKGAEIAEN